jgi:hypothetical protein
VDSKNIKFERVYGTLYIESYKGRENLHIEKFYYLTKSSLPSKCLFELDNKGLRRDEKDIIIQNK